MRRFFPRRQVLLGTLGMLGGPLMLVHCALEQLGWLTPFSPADGIISLGYLSGWMCSAAGMRECGALGDCPFATAVYASQIAGIALAEAGSIWIVVNPQFDPGSRLFRIADAACPLSHIYMLIVAIPVLTTGAWTGWRRLVPLACGLVAPIALTAAVIGGRPAMEWTFAVYTGVAWTLLGYAVRTAPLRPTRLLPLVRAQGA